MDEKDILNAWRESSSREQQVLDQHRGKYEQMAKRQSMDLFARIRKNIIGETIASLIVAIGLPALFIHEPLFFWPLVGVMVLALGAGVRVYARYWKDISAINEDSLVASLARKLAVLTRYIRQLKVYLYIFMPLGFAFGAAFAVKDEELTTVQWMVLVAILLPFLVLLIWLGRKYVYALYGKHLKRIQGIYEELKKNLK